jgi:hypothetical protein
VIENFLGDIPKNCLCRGLCGIPLGLDVLPAALDPESWPLFELYDCDVLANGCPKYFLPNLFFNDASMRFSLIMVKPLYNIKIVVGGAAENRFTI